MGTKEIAVLTGGDAERCAEKFLTQHSLVLLQRNYRCRFGEIDLIMRDGAVLVFVEVRLRGNSRYGGAPASVTPHKQRRIQSAAQMYLRQFKRPPRCRFDVVALEGGEIQWIRAAFECS